MSTVGTQASGSDFTGLNEAMKILFEDPLNDNVVEDSEFLSMFEQNTNVKESDGGRYIEMAHYFELPGSVGARAEGDYLPVPEGPIIKNSQVYLKHVYATTEMSGEAYRRVKASEAAFLDWAERALPDTIRKAVDTMDRMLMGFGQGAVARVNDATPATALDIDSAYGITGLSDAHLLFRENQRIRVGPNIDGSGLRANSALITNIKNDISQLTIDALPTATADNDYIFLGDAAGNASRQGGTSDRELMGLLGMVDDASVLATFQGLARATYRLWNSIVIDASTGGWTGALTEELLTKLDDDVFVLGGGKPDILLTSRSGARSYWKSLKADRSMNDPRSYTGGKGGLSIALGDRELALKVSRKCPSELAWLLQKDTFRRWHNTGWKWDDTTGSVWNRVTDGTGRKDAYYAVAVFCAQTGNVAPRKNGKVKGLTAA